MPGAQVADHDEPKTHGNLETNLLTQITERCLINDLNASLYSFIYLEFVVHLACSRILLQEHLDWKFDLTLNYCLIAIKISS